MAHVRGTPEHEREYQRRWRAENRPRREGTRPRPPVFSSPPATIVAQPACMTPPELALWAEVAGIVNNGTADPCADCTAAFSATMRTEGRCNGIPGLIRKPSRKVATSERLRGRLNYIRSRCVTLGIDPGHAELVG